MKRFILGISIVSILALGTLAFAQGMGGWNSGHMMGQGHMSGYGMMGSGYGSRHMGPGYGGYMRGWGAPSTGTDQKFLDETADLRKEIHEKNSNTSKPGAILK
jgi:hypothetical protein